MLKAPFYAEPSSALTSANEKWEKRRGKCIIRVGSGGRVEIGGKEATTSKCWICHNSLKSLLNKEKFPLKD